MHPTIRLPLLGTAVQSHDLMVVLAVLCAATLGGRWAVQREGLPGRRVALALMMIAAVTLVAGRVHFILANLGRLPAPLESALTVSSGSLHAPGAILGAVIGCLISLRVLDLPVRRFVDGLAPAAGLGIAIARVGCFFHGCCFGEVCDLPWAVTLPPESYVRVVHLERGILPPGTERSLPVHPLPIYFALVGVALAVFLLWLRPRKQYDGQLALVLVFGFSASSALLELLRIDDSMRVYWGSAPQLLWVTVAMTVVSAGVLCVAQSRAPVRSGCFDREGADP